MYSINSLYKSLYSNWPEVINFIYLYNTKIISPYRNARVGDISKIRVEHDNAGWGAGWMLDRVEVVNMASNRAWQFPCGQWLDSKKGDGQIARELYPRD